MASASNLVFIRLQLNQFYLFLEHKLEPAKLLDTLLMMDKSLMMNQNFIVRSPLNNGVNQRLSNNLAVKLPLELSRMVSVLNLLLITPWLDQLKLSSEHKLEPAQMLAIQLMTDQSPPTFHFTVMSHSNNTVKPVF